MSVAAMVANARRTRTGRVALAAVWVGLFIGTCGFWQLDQHLRRHPLDAEATS